MVNLQHSNMLKHLRCNRLQTESLQRLKLNSLVAAVFEEVAKLTSCVVGLTQTEKIFKHICKSHSDHKSV